MPFTILDTLPFSHEQAVAMLAGAPWTAEERRYIVDGGLAVLHHGFGEELRKNWHLWEATSPLARHYQRRFGLGHADDMSSLIIEDMVARLRGEPYDMVARIRRFKEHWRKQNVDPETMREIQ